MELNVTQTPAQTRLHGEEIGHIVNAGQTLKIETSPGGNEILDVTVPAGKQWSVIVNVDIRETDV